MNYKEHLEKFRNAQIEGKLPETAQPDSEEMFNALMSPISKTPELNEDPAFRLTYQKVYLHIRKRIERGNAPNKEEALKELDKIYNEVAEKMNLL